MTKSKINVTVLILSIIPSANIIKLWKSDIVSCVRILFVVACFGIMSVIYMSLRFIYLVFQACWSSLDSQRAKVTLQPRPKYEKHAGLICLCEDRCHFRSCFWIDKCSHTLSSTAPLQLCFCFFTNGQLSWRRFEPEAPWLLTKSKMALIHFHSLPPLRCPPAVGWRGGFRCQLEGLSPLGWERKRSLTRNRPISDSRRQVSGHGEASS